MKRIYFDVKELNADVYNIIVEYNKRPRVTGKREKGRWIYTATFRDERVLTRNSWGSLFSKKERRIIMDKNIEEKHGCLLVSFDFEAGDVPTVLVGYKSKTKKDDVDIINAFQGSDAIDIFKKLTVINKKGE